MCSPVVCIEYRPLYDNIISTSAAGSPHSQQVSRSDLHDVSIVNFPTICTGNGCRSSTILHSIKSTRHRASTSMYSLTFCVRFLLPECHQRKPAVQAAAVMLRTPPSTANHRRASHAHFPYTARNFQNALRHPPVSGQQRAQTPPSL